MVALTFFAEYESMTHTKRSFLGEDFLLDNEVSFELYHQYAAAQPIIDYHNHLSPKDIAQNKKFSSLTEAWLAGDHYKWRAMRANGIAEKYITGDASPPEKFHEWAKTVPATVRNPLYHWTHLELRRYFGINKLLDVTTADEIYDNCTGLLQHEEFRVQGLLLKMNVQVVCTTDDPVDNLEYHVQFAKQSGGLKMYPTFRPDKAYATQVPADYNLYLDKLSAASKVSILSFDNLLEALANRIGYFDQLGCRAADHGLEHLYFDAKALSNAPTMFKKIRTGKSLTQQESLEFKCAVLIHLCQQYHKIGWAQQFHLGALRNNNSRMMRKLGPDAGFDSIGDFPQAKHLTLLLDYLDNTNQLARTILYNLQPSQNEVFATMAGNFNDGSLPGKMQVGSGWWFLDQKDGMEKQINSLSNMGLLSGFVGMVTDSRSFLSFPRHEYFRRILCNLIGRDVEKGELPDDRLLLGTMIRDISFNNSKRYFHF